MDTPCGSDQARWVGGRQASLGCVRMARLWLMWRLPLRRRTSRAVFTAWPAKSDLCAAQRQDCSTTLTRQQTSNTQKDAPRSLSSAPDAMGPDDV